MDTDISIIVPTRNETANVGRLHHEVTQAMVGLDFELLFVDDSDDETPRVLAAMATDDARVRVLHRTQDKRSGGLGGAVMAGFREARGRALIVMDADLQHPPSVIPALIASLALGQTDIVVATRYGAGGSPGGLNGWLRLAISQACRRLVHATLPRTRGTSDPLGGFFALKDTVLAGSQLRPDGYKILLDILVRCEWSNLSEVPYEFASRFAGSSKSNVAEGRRFLRHVRALRGVRQSASPPKALPVVVPAGEHSQSLRVLILTSEAPPVISGISTTVAGLQTGLCERGHIVDVISRADFPRFIRHEIRLSAFALFWPRFRRDLYPYDVVNVHGPVPTISEVFLLLVKTLNRLHRPAVVYTHHSDLAIPRLERWCALYNSITGRLAQTADVVVVSTAAYKTKLSRVQGAPVELVPWGIDAQGKVQERPTRPESTLRVLFVGQLRPYKGVPILIDAVAKMRNVSLTIVGAGPERPELDKQVEARAATNIKLLGRLSDEDLWKAYSVNDVVVLPSTTTAEAYGLVLAEGMVAGCIPVASDLPGVREVVADAGLLVTPGSVESLRQALARLAEDDGLRSRMAHSAGDRAKGLTVQVTAERYEEVFKDAVRAVTKRHAAMAVPSRWANPEHLLAELAGRLGIGRVSLSLLMGGKSPLPARVWSHGASSFKVQEAPVAQYVASRNMPLIIGAANGANTELGTLLIRPELTSALLVPLRMSKKTISVIGMSTGPDDQGRLLDKDDLALAMHLLGAGSGDWPESRLVQDGRGLIRSA